MTLGTDPLPAWVTDPTGASDGPPRSALEASSTMTPAPPARVRPATVVIAATAVGLALAAGVAAPRVGDVSVTLLGSSVRPPAGLEEAGAPLGTPPAVEPAGVHAFSETRQDASGATVPVTWSACRPVHVVVDPGGAPEGFEGTVRTAVAELSSATGLTFVVDGTTSEPASTDRGPYLPEEYGRRWAPVLIRFAAPASVPELADASGVTLTHTVADASGTQFLVSGAVYLDRELLTYPPVGWRQAWEPVLRHELGHLAGLDHVDDPSELMYPVTSSQTDWSAGDRTGLAALGGGECAPGV